MNKHVIFALYTGTMLIDAYHRIHDYLRISLTDKCNLKCSYCDPVDSEIESSTQSQFMTVDEIDHLASIFVREGIKKIRLTGGEPLVRKDAKEIIQRLSKYPVQLAITTNAILADQYLDSFLKAGIHSINVSLDSLQKEKFAQITGRDYFDKVKSNIDLLLENGFHVKVNVVVIKNVNHEEILDFIKWTEDIPVHIRFIEFMPFAGNAWDHEKVFTHREILELIQKEFSVQRIPTDVHDTAKPYFISGHRGTFAVISTMSEPFCQGCNRIRLTADGKLKNCLFSKGETDLLTALRNGDDVLPLIKYCIAVKNERLGGQFSSLAEAIPNADMIDNRSMIKIGG